MSITFKKVKKVLTPSDLWDNGLYRVSEEEVNFPKEVLRRAVLEDIYCKGVRDDEECLRITVDGVSWIVVKKGYKAHSLREDVGD